MEEYVDCIDDKVYKNLYKVLNNYEMYKSIWGARGAIKKIRRDMVFVYSIPHPASSEHNTLWLELIKQLPQAIIFVPYPTREMSTLHKMIWEI